MDAAFDGPSPGRQPGHDSEMQRATDETVVQTDNRLRSESISIVANSVQLELRLLFDRQERPMIVTEMVLFDLVRQPAPPLALPGPSTTRNPRRPSHREIVFRHPGYNDANNSLLKLYASDKYEGRHGLYARFALDACGIITGNRWDGWLSRSRDGTSAREDPRSILQEPSYYFHLPDTAADVPYAIVPSFADWRFPHGRDGAQLPSGWQKLDIDEGIDKHFARSHFSSAVRYRDETCRMSGRRASTQIAHLCPVKEQEWIRQNSMRQYNRLGEPGSEDIANLLLLRADLHIEFDRGLFVFVPKRKMGQAVDSIEQDELVVHMLQAEEELEYEYHNRSLQPWTGAGAGVEWLFTRLAWSIFPHLSGFLADKVPRQLRVYNQDGEASDKTFSVENCMALSMRARGARSRSQSPQKRSRGPGSDLIALRTEQLSNQATDVIDHGSGTSKRKWCDEEEGLSHIDVSWSQDSENARGDKRRRKTCSSCESKTDGVSLIDISARSSTNDETVLHDSQISFSSGPTEDDGESTGAMGWERVSRLKERYLELQRGGVSSERLRAWQEEMDWAQKKSKEEAILTRKELKRWCRITQG